MSEITKEVGRRIREARELKGMTQEELATKLGTGKSTVSKYENGSINPSLELLNRIAIVLGLEFGVTFK